MKKLFAMLLVMIFVLLALEAEGQNVYKVGPNGDYQTIGEAVWQARAFGGEVWVSEGIYYEHVTLGDKITALKGGYNLNYTERDPKKYVTTIDGSKNVGYNGVEIFASLLLDGFTIENCDAMDASGILVYVRDDTRQFTISNNIIRKNKNYYGGEGTLAVYAMGNARLTVNILSNEIYENVDGIGTAIYITSGGYPGEGQTAYIKANIENNDIHSNTFLTSLGPGVTIESTGSSQADILLKKNKIHNNIGPGAAALNITNLDISSISLIAEENEITQNQGGAIEIGDYSGGLNITLTKNTFMQNYDVGFGGTIDIYSYNTNQKTSEIELTGNLILENTAGVGGGGININSEWATGQPTQVKLNNNIIAYNEAVGNFMQYGEGGGIRTSGEKTNLELNNNVVYGNRAGNKPRGAGLMLGSPTTIRNSVVRENVLDGTGGYGEDIYLAADTYVEYSNVDENKIYLAAGTLTISDISSADPSFEDPLNVNFTLVPNSPCIDGGNPSVEYDDQCTPPGKGTSRNDIGYYGGENCSLVLPDRTLTLNSMAGGTTQPAPGTHDYFPVEILLEALADSGYSFSGWTGDVPVGKENENPLWLFMDSSKNITANFAACTLPQTPSNPNPVNQETGVPVNTSLSWSSDGTSYDVYFGTSTPVPVGNVTTQNYPLSGLDPHTTYYWKIVAKNSCGDSSGPVWSFTTLKYNPPVANNDVYSTDEDTPLNVSAPGVLGNDTDADGDSLTALLFSYPSNGTLTLNSDGSFTYTPNTNFNGTDSFTYKASDSRDQSNTATVTINVSPLNDQPVANNQDVSTDEDAAKEITLSGSDIDSQNLNFSISKTPCRGTLSTITGKACTPNGNGSTCTAKVVYTPYANYNGSDNFTFKVNDGSLESQATVIITVNAVNDAPVAVNDFYNVDEDGVLAVSIPGVLGNDTDLENNSLTAFLVSGPSHGTLNFNTNGSFTYTPTPNYVGEDSFAYKASDGLSESNIATVTITVLPAELVPNQGAYGTEISIKGEGFGLSKGKVILGEKNSIKILTWEDNFIKALVNKALKPGVYEVTVITKTRLAIKKPDFTFKAPEDVKINPNEAAEGRQVNLVGKFFGTKKNRIYLGYYASKFTMKSCKVISWFMDPVTGDSEVVFVVPRMKPQTYKLMVDPYGSPTPPQEVGLITLKVPEIIDVIPKQGVRGDEIGVWGKFLGTKKGKVYLEDFDTKKSCRITSWPTDPLADEGYITFVVPNIATGLYDLTITNSLGSSTIQDGFTIY